jgi:hypothetical protein
MSELIFIHEENDDQELALLNDLERLHKAVNIHITGRKELFAVVADDNGLAGALYLSDSPEDFDFDVLVFPDRQCAGVGRQLMSLAMDEWHTTRSEFPDAQADILVLSPAVRHTLYQNDFIVDRSIKSDLSEVIMTHREMDDASRLALLKNVILPPANGVSDTQYTHLKKYLSPILKQTYGAKAPLQTLDNVFNLLIEGKGLNHTSTAFLATIAYSAPRSNWHRELLLSKLTNASEQHYPFPADHSDTLMDVFSKQGQECMKITVGVLNRQQESTFDTESLLFAVNETLKNGWFPFENNVDAQLTLQLINELPIPNDIKQEVRERSKQTIHPIAQQQVELVPDSPTLQSHSTDNAHLTNRPKI